MPSHAPFIVDCDTGRDDALTLWLASQKKLPLVGVVASYGNTLRKNVIENTARVLAMGGESCPLFVGADRPMRSHPLYEPVVLGRQQVSGNGLCDLVLPETNSVMPVHLTTQERNAALMELARIHGPLDYYIIGPSTNFAQTLSAMGTEINKMVRRIVLMAGRLETMWDEDPSPDFNIACDPYALNEILKTDLEVIFVPLDATWPICMDIDEIESLTAQSDLAQTAKDLMIAHCRKFAPEPIFRFHDPTVLCVYDHPEALKECKVELDVDPESDDFGRLHHKGVGRNVKVFETNPDLCACIKHDILEALGLK